ncbi:hypothetical protein EJ110_NYTH48825 [Nymphaea thermarum]|nr:hypothetical protein EJ110_NYTH48825 [Nymphaea thermarum]
MWLCVWETFLFLPLVSPVGEQAVQGPKVLVCCAWSVGSRLPNLGVLGEAEYLTLDFTQPRMSALPLQRMQWIHSEWGTTGIVSRLVGLKIRFLFVQMEYHRRGKGRAGPSSEAHREPSPTHSDVHTLRGDSVSEPQYAQLGGGAQTPPRQTPPVDQQTILLTTLQMLTSLVQTMVSNQRSNASPSGDTSTPVREKATTVSYQQFLAMQPPIFSGGCSYDKAKHWIEEIERIFVLLGMPEENKVNYGTYLLKGNALDWWKSTLEIRFAGQPSLSWMQFRDSFLDTYYHVHVRDQKMQEFLDLQQNQLNLKDYITRYRHLEAYCPHFYTTDGARAGKFVRGLREGLRSKVLSSRPRDLDEVVTMARCIEEDWEASRREEDGGGAVGGGDGGGTDDGGDDVGGADRGGGGGGGLVHWARLDDLELKDSKLEAFWKNCNRATEQAVQGPKVLVYCAWSVGSRLPNLGVLGEAEYLTLDFTQPRMSALPLQRMQWIHSEWATMGIVSRLTERPVKKEELRAIAAQHHMCTGINRHVQREGRPRHEVLVEWEGPNNGTSWEDWERIRLCFSKRSWGQARSKEGGSVAGLPRDLSTPADNAAEDRCTAGSGHRLGLTSEVHRLISTSSKDWRSDSDSFALVGDYPAVGNQWLICKLKELGTNLFELN